MWALELLAEALGTGLIVGFVGVVSTYSSFKDGPDPLAHLLTAPFAIALIAVPTALVAFAMTGYVFTSAICRITWRTSAVRMAVVCAMLYLVHSELFLAFIMHPQEGGGWPLPFVVGPLGALWTFGCVLAGERLNKRWQTKEESRTSH